MAFSMISNHNYSDSMSIFAVKGLMHMKKGYWVKWAKATGIRALRTFAESMLAYIGTGALVLNDVNWVAAFSAGAFGAVTAVLLALAGLPEVNEEDE